MRGAILMSAALVALIAAAQSPAAQAMSGQRSGTVVDSNLSDTARKPAAGSGVMVPVLTREIYQYDGGGRRDPFLSLVRTGALRPHISEMQLMTTFVGATNSNATVLIKGNPDERVLVKVGDMLGRYRVVRIENRSVTFQIEEYGYSRQERLTMGDTTTVRNQ